MTAIPLEEYMKLKTIPFKGFLAEEKQDNIRVWIDALRSKKFEQGKEYLHHNGRFCCIGVACRINDVPLYNMGFSFDDNVSNVRSYNDKNPNGTWFLRTFGFNYSRHMATNGDCPSTLMTLNDFHNASFDIIADVIQACMLDREAIEININYP